MHRSTPLISASLLALAVPAAALDSFSVGPRALAMGGTGVASADDHTAQFYNPATFGFFGRQDDSGQRTDSDNLDLQRKDWGLGIDAAAGYRVHGDVAKYLDQLSGIDYNKLGTTGVQTQADLDAVLKAVDSLSNVAKDGNAVTFDATAGATLRIWRLAVGARVFSEASAVVRDVDFANLGIGTGGAALATQINATSTPQGNASDVFTASQIAQLTAALGGGAAATTAVNQLAYQAQALGYTSTQINDLFSTLVTAVAGGGSLENNTTKVVLRGYAIGELPVSYGHAINDNLSFGVSLKYMVGRVYGTSVQVFQDNAVDVLRHADENYRQTSAVGVDAGVLVRMPWLQAGVTGRNLNRPVFKGPQVAGVQVPDLTVEPQVTAGLAIIPHEYFSIAADGDLSIQKTALSGYGSRMVRAGVEFTPGHVFALRAGAYANLENRTIPWVATAGVGLNLWLIRADLAVAASPELITVDGQELPRESRASLGVAIDF